MLKKDGLALKRLVHSLNMFHYFLIQSDVFKMIKILDKLLIQRSVGYFIARSFLISCRRFLFIPPESIRRHLKETSGMK